MRAQNRTRAASTRARTRSPPRRSRSAATRRSRKEMAPASPGTQARERPHVPQSPRLGRCTQRRLRSRHKARLSWHIPGASPRRMRTPHSCTPTTKQSTKAPATRSPGTKTTCPITAAPATRMRFAEVTPSSARPPRAAIPSPTKSTRYTHTHTHQIGPALPSPARTDLFSREWRRRSSHWPRLKRQWERGALTRAAGLALLLWNASASAARCSQTASLALSISKCPSTRARNFWHAHRRPAQSGFCCYSIENQACGCLRECVSEWPCESGARKRRRVCEQLPDSQQARLPQQLHHKSKDEHLKPPAFIACAGSSPAASTVPQKLAVALCPLAAIRSLPPCRVFACLLCCARVPDSNRAPRGNAPPWPWVEIWLQMTSWTGIPASSCAYPATCCTGSDYGGSCQFPFSEATHKAHSLQSSMRTALAAVK